MLFTRLYIIDNLFNRIAICNIKREYAIILNVVLLGLCNLDMSMFYDYLPALSMFYMFCVI